MDKIAYPVFPHVMKQPLRKFDDMEQLPHTLETQFFELSPSTPKLFEDVTKAEVRFLSREFDSIAKPRDKPDFLRSAIRYAHLSL